MRTRTARSSRPRRMRREGARRHHHGRTGAIAPAVATAIVLLVGVILGTPSPVEAGTAPPSIVGSWGDNDDGGLGNNSNLDSGVPVAADTSGALSGNTPSAIATGDRHTCVIAANRAYCWGYNAHGQLGNSTMDDSSIPVAVTTSGALNGRTIIAITAGGDHTCVLTDNAKPYCWGANANGELGNNTTTDYPFPVPVTTSGVLDGRTIRAITAGGENTCVLADNKPFCWGRGSSGELGNNMATASPVPVAVSTAQVLNGRAATAIATGGDHTCVLAGDKPYCWGANSYGQLGNNSVGDALVPVAVDTTGVLYRRPVVAITSAAFHTCALSGGRAYCWGYNGQGQLGNNSLVDAHVPVPVTTTGALYRRTVTAITGGARHTCAIASNTPYCWGGNDDGELGNSTMGTGTAVPVAVTTSGALAGKVAVEIDSGRARSTSLAMPDPEFCDVTATAPFFTDIVWLSAVGITTGYSDGCFRPATNVARQAMAAFLYRTLYPRFVEPACTGTTRVFTDVPATDPFCGTIEWLAHRGIASGYPDGTFHPQNTVTRQAMAAFLYRTLDLGQPDRTCTGPTRTYPDVPASNPFCGAIEWLAMSGITTGYPDGTFHPQGTVTRQAMAAFLHRAVT